MLFFVLMYVPCASCLMHSLKPQQRKDFLRRREGQTTHYGLRKVLRCAATKATLILSKSIFSIPSQKTTIGFLRIWLVLTAYEKKFSFFFAFVICRFCTSKQSFGYVFLDLARCVFVKVFVRD